VSHGHPIKLAAQLANSSRLRFFSALQTRLTPSLSGARVQARESFASTTQEDGSFTVRGVRDGRSESKWSG